MTEHSAERNPPTVLIVDHNAKDRNTLSLLLDAEGLSSRAFQSATGFLEFVTARTRGCVLLAARMPNMTAPQVLRRLAEREILLPVIVITGFGEVTTAFQAFRLGARDLFVKPVNASMVLESVHGALKHDREQRARREISASIRTSLAKLSQREAQVLQLLADGLLNKQIAWQLGLSEKTVAAHRARILRKTGAGSLTLLVRMMTEAGQLESAGLVRRPGKPARPAGAFTPPADTADLPVTSSAAA